MCTYIKTHLFSRDTPFIRIDKIYLQIFDSLNIYYNYYDFKFKLSSFNNVPGNNKNKQTKQYQIEHDSVMSFFSQGCQSSHC